MKIPISGTVAVAALLLLALASSGCESTPLLAPTGSTMTLLASPAVAGPDANLDPTEAYYFSNIYVQLLAGGGGTTTTGGTAAATNATPLVDVSVTLSTTGGNLRFNSCVQGACSLDGALCPGGAADCVQPTSQPVTLETDSSGVVQVTVAVTEDDPSNVTVSALSGTITQTIAIVNPLGADNGEPVAAIGVSPPSPADASSGSVTVSFISESTDPDGDEITCYEWTVSSSTTGASKVWGPRRTVFTDDYTSEQSLNVLLRISDDPNAETSCDENSNYSPNVDTISGYLVCNNTAPTASFAVGSPVIQTTTYEYPVNGQGSSDDETEIQLYEWDCDNGQDPTGVQTTCTYNRTTTTKFYEIELIVTDYSEETGCELESSPAVTSVEVPALGLP